MAGAGMTEDEREELEALRVWSKQTMAVLGRALDDSTEEGRTLLHRLVVEGETLLLIDALNNVFDHLDQLRAARQQAITRLRDGGDHYAAAIVEGLA